MLISFFFKQYKRKEKAIKIGRGTKRKQGTQSSVETAPIRPEADELELDEQLEQTVIENENEAPVDTGEQAHDDKVIRTTRKTAIAQMRAQGIVITEEENKSALALFPKVAGLARRVHDTPVLKALEAL
ncbi:hypothetical protein C8R44DRAFT_651155 [Mycena epipterygia]|nr:hypothetical protein C8R44DRAFT_651155 [Mycena epipterygia]